MGARQIDLGAVMRQRMMAGLDLAAAAVKATMGPRGRTVLLGDSGAPPRPTKDGASVLRSIDLADRVHNAGVALLKQAAGHVEQTVGDGVSTTVVLAQAIAQAGLRPIAVGASPIAVKRGIDRAARAACNRVIEMGRPASADDLTAVGLVAANGDAPLATALAEALASVGPDGFVEIEAAEAFGVDWRRQEGLVFAGGWLSLHFATDPARRTCVLDAPRVLLHDGRIEDARTIMPLLQATAERGAALLVVAETVTGPALAAMALNAENSGLRIAAARTPQSAQERRALLDDLAALTGARVLRAEAGDTLDGDCTAALGSAARVTLTDSETRVSRGPDTDDAALSARRATVRRLIEEADDHARQPLEARLGALSGGCARVHIGGHSEAEIAERTDRARDALRAMQAARRSGVVIGGGAALLHAARALDGFGAVSEDEAAGVAALREALAAPLTAIATNAGFSGTFIAGKLRDAADDTLGFEATSGEIAAIGARGVLDATAVATGAIEAAASAAGLLLLCDVCITQKEDA